MKFRDEGDGGGTGGDAPPAENPWYHDLFPQSAHAELERFKKPEDLVRSYRTLRQDLSERPAKGSITVPKDDASEEQKLAFRQAMGIPGKADEYHLEGVQLTGGVPGESSVDTELLGKIQQVAHRTNMTQGQFTALVKEYQELLTGRQEQSKASIIQAQQEADAYLREHFGENLDVEKQALAAGMKAMMGGDDASWLTEFFDTPVASPSGKMGRLAENGHFLRFMFTLRAMSGNDRFVDPNRQQGGAPGGEKQPHEVTFDDMTDAQLESIYGRDFMNAPRG